MKQQQPKKLPYDIFNDFENEVAKQCPHRAFKNGRRDIDYRALPTYSVIIILACLSKNELASLKYFVAEHLKYELRLIHLMGVINLLQSKNMAAKLVGLMNVSPKRRQPEAQLSFDF